MADRAISAVGTPLPKPERFRARTLKTRDREAERREVYDAVTRRDRYRCRACGKRADPNAIGLTEHGHHHYLIYRSRGGRHAIWNVCLVCPKCHAEIHAKRLFLSGNAEDELVIERV